MAIRNGEPDQALGDLYPFEDRFLDVSTGHSMHYVDVGRAGLRRPTFLLVHGNPTWSFTWRSFIPPLARLGRVVVPDHIGFGRSDHPTDPDYHTLDRHIRNLEELVARLRLKRIIPVVHDWGGPIGLGYATRQPKDLAGLVVLDTWAFTGHDAPRLSRAYKALRTPRLGRALLTRSNLFVDTVIPRFTTHPVPDDVMEGYRHPFPTRESREAISAWVRMVPASEDHPDHPTMEAVEAGLSELDVPARILWGRNDPAFRRRQAEAFAKRLPKAEAPRYFDAGHFLQEDIPQALVAEIAAFAQDL